MRREDSLNRRYPYLRAWGRLLGSYDYYIVSQQERALLEGVPKTVIYFSDTEKKWVLWKNIHSRDTKQRVKKFVDAMEKEFV